MMTRDQLAHRIYTTSTLTGSFQLRSGAVFHEYFDKYRFEADPKLLSAVAHALHPLVPPEVDALAGLELGGIPLVTMLSQLTGRPARFVRKAAKSYGTCQLAEGGGDCQPPSCPRRRCRHIRRPNYRILSGPTSAGRQRHTRLVRQ